MKINDKIIDRIFTLIKGKYPIIDDLDYRYEILRRGGNTELHYFTFYYDIEKIHDMFPDAMINLRKVNYGTNLPIEGFWDYTTVYHGDLYKYGISIRKLIESLINSVKRSDESYVIRFINSNSYYN